MVKYIIFDFDGTLVDSKEVGISAINKLAQKYGFKKLEQKDIEHLRGLSIIERCKFLNVPVYKLPFWALEFYSLYKQSLNDIVMFDGMKELLNDLTQKGYYLAIISSNSEKNIREFLCNNNIDNIKEIYCSNNIFGKDKIINKFLKSHRLKNSEVIYIGDEQRDIIACKKAGVDVVWVGWGYDTAESVEKEKPEYMLFKPSEILEIV